MKPPPSTDHAAAAAGRARGDARLSTIRAWAGTKPGVAEVEPVAMIIRFTPIARPPSIAIHNLIQACTGLILILHKRKTRNGEKVKTCLEIVLKSYQSLKNSQWKGLDTSTELASPQFHSLRLGPKTGGSLFGPTRYEEYAGYVRYNQGLSFSLEPDGKAKIPSEHDWLRLVLGQILGYSRDLFTFMKVGLIPPNRDSIVSYLLKVGYDHRNQEPSSEEKSLEFVISLLVGSKADAEESFLNSPVHATVVKQLSSLSSDEIVLDCLICLSSIVNRMNAG